MPCNLLAETHTWIDNAIAPIDWGKAWATSAAAYTLVALAEFGDKSQLVCMTLAARHRHWPVLWGAILAFSLLNAIAVIFGVVAGKWLPDQIVAILVALLFAGFGVRSLLSSHEDEDEIVEGKSTHGIFATTFLMIFLAEFGDKTQLAVAGLGAAQSPTPVWLGATAALTTTSALGIWAGKTVLRKVPQRTMDRLGGILFLCFAIFAAYKALPPDLSNTYWETLKNFLAIHP